MAPVVYVICQNEIVQERIKTTKNMLQKYMRRPWRSSYEWLWSSFKSGPMQYFQYSAEFNIFINIYNDGIESICTKLTSCPKLVKAASPKQKY